MMKKEVPLRFFHQLEDNPLEAYKQQKELINQRVKEYQERKAEKKLEKEIEKQIEEQLQEVVERELQKLFEGFGKQ